MTGAVRPTDRFMTPVRISTILVIVSALTALAAVSLRPRTTEFFGILLSVFAAAYFGFAFADGRGRRVIVEIAAIVAFLALTIVGVWISRPVLAVGMVAHGLWDLLHHPRVSFGADVPLWYVYGCLGYDLVVAALVVLV